MPRRFPPRPRRRRRFVVEQLETKQLLTATFVVTTTADSGVGSLRQAILDVDATPFVVGDPDQIDFAISGTGVQTIAPATPLPAITHPVSVDATTQPGYAGSPLVVLDGVNAVAADGSTVDGLTIATSDDDDPHALGVGTSSVAGLGVVRFSGSGIVSNDGHDFTGLVIGTDKDGGQDLGNGGAGIFIEGSKGYINVTDSVIENNGLRGVGSDSDYQGLGTVGVTQTNVVQANNDTQGTQLELTTTTLNQTTEYPMWGSQVTLSFTLTNTGTNPATNAGLILYHDADDPVASFVSATASQGTITTDQLPDSYNAAPFASLGTIQPGASATVSVTIQISAEPTSGPTMDQIVTYPVSPKLDYQPARVPTFNYLYPSVDGTPTPTTPTPTTPTPTTPTPTTPTPTTPTPTTPTPTTPTPTTPTPTTPTPTTPTPTTPTPTTPTPTTPTPTTPTPTVPTPTVPTPTTPTSPTPTPITVPPADLVVSATGPGTASVGAASLFQIAVRNAGSGAAADAVAAVNLGNIPLGSFYAIESQTGAGGSGTLTPMPGRPGVYLVDLGSLAAGASAAVDVMVIPAASGALSVAAAAADAGNPTADPNPADNLTYVGTTVAPAIASGSLTSASTIQLDFGSALSRTQAESLTHYQLVTTSGTTTTPVSLRSASYIAAQHRVILRLARPLPTGPTPVQLTIAGLGTTADAASTTLTLARNRSKR